MNGYQLARHPAIPANVTGYSLFYSRKEKKWRAGYTGKHHGHTQRSFFTEALAVFWLKKLIAEHKAAGEIDQAFLCKAWTHQTQTQRDIYHEQ